MPSYDLVYIVRPDLEPDALKAVIDRLGQRIIDRGGKIDATDAWGKRRLAHVIRKQREGTYVQTRFTIAPNQVAEIRHQVALSEEVLRSMLTIAVGKLPSPAAPSPAPVATAPVAPSPAPGATAPVAPSPAPGATAPVAPSPAPGAPAVTVPSSPPAPSPAPSVAPKPTEV